jgi:hypothetical protein
MTYWLKLDLYGSRFEWNFRGVETYRTVCGAMFSLLVIVFVGLFTLNNFLRLILRRSPEIYVYSQVIDAEELHEIGKLDIFENRLNMAVKVFSEGKLLTELNDDIVELKAGQFHEDNHFETGFEPIELVPCHKDYFSHSDEKEYAEFKLDQALCLDPESEDAVVGGKINTENTYYGTAIGLSKKERIPSRYSTQEVNEYIEGLTVQIILQ